MGPTDGRTTRVKTIIATGHACGSAEWIRNAVEKELRSTYFEGGREQSSRGQDNVTSHLVEVLGVRLTYHLNVF